MLFTKSAPAMSRSALIKSKLFWTASPSSNQGSVSPGFFVSTPQFNRHQQNQIAIYYEDTRGAGSSNSSSESHSIDNPYLALTAANSANAAPALHFDDETKEEVTSRSYVTFNSANSQFNQLESDVLGTSEIIEEKSSTLGEKSDPLAEAIDQVERITVIDGMVQKMHRLYEAGSHGAVLATFEVLEAFHTVLPVDAYNLVLNSLVSTCDVNTLLEAYEKMLTRGIRPNDATYCIILNALVKTAESLQYIRGDLEPYLGSSEGILESVDEIHEGLAVEEYIVLSQNILQAVVSSHPKPWSKDLQTCLNRVVNLSIEKNLSVSEDLLSHVTKSATSVETQPSIQAAADVFSSLSPLQQQSENAQLAMLHSYFKFKEFSGAVAFFTGCGCPSYLLKTLLVGFASNRMVATARNWIEKAEAKPDYISDTLKAIPHENAHEILPSATELFYKLIAGNGGGGGSGSSNGDGDMPKNVDESNLDCHLDTGRCAFIRLCISAGNEAALYMALKESHLANVTWDAVTVTEAINFLSQKNQPLLAADICSWQVPKLVNVYKEKNLRGFVDQEVVSSLIESLESRNQLSLDVSLRILPVISRCTGTRRKIIELVGSAKLDTPHSISNLMTPERLESVVNSLASIMIDSSSMLTEEEYKILHRVFPLFIEDSLKRKARFSTQSACIVLDALTTCEHYTDLIENWKESQIVGRPLDSQLPSEVSNKIKRYALTPNGLDHAIELLKDQLRVMRSVDAEAINAVIFACSKYNSSQLLEHLYSILPKVRPTLNSIMIVSALIKDRKLLEDAHSYLLNVLHVYPDHTTYLGIIKECRSDWSYAFSLFKEAKNDAGLLVDQELYNTIAMILAENGRNTEFASVLSEMQKNGFQISTETYGSILSMYLRLNEGEKSLEILKSMSITAKSMLDVKIFNEMMSYFVHKSPNRHTTLEIFMELRSTGTLATPLTYKLLMEAYLLRDGTEKPNLESADRVLSLMRRDGTPITTQCFATLLRARGVLFRDFEGARNFYRGLVKNSRVLPDRGIFQALIESYILDGKRSDVPQVLDEMKKYHVPIDEGISKLVSDSE